ncbi:MAG: hypothetical protein NDJ94_04870 [Vicinamibacteria bacterium]|jgi:hypothetical protein|nr:hypothetical protein [Vicinamibacteria bacterium]
MAEPACPDEARLRAIFDQVEAHLERRYGIPVVITDVVAPFTGDRDGREIQIDHDQDVASAVFVLIHVFGHTVQWNLSARAREIGTVAQQQPTPELLEELRAGLAHFYATGEKAPFFSFWRRATPLLNPLPIPPFTPTRWTSRWSGTVV